MRLTLRTLLAWLDDTLSPSEVREIGKQVAESPFAKDLVEKIHKVTRQRRLTVPPGKGADATDANVVASYLDNQLDPDQVAELEKRCLVSDVHLAEVASIHQILSLIGQKAKVPVAARHRMYHLVKGREAVRPEAARASNQTEPRPVTEPVQPWVSAPPPARPWYDRFGLPAAVVGLMLVLGWTAWRTVSTGDDAPHVGRPGLASNAPVRPPAARKPDKTDAVAAAPGGPVEPAADKPAPADPAGDKAAEKSAPEGDAAKAQKAAAEVPPGSVGLARKPSGVLLRFKPETRLWERVAAATPLKEQDRLLGLEPFRSTVEIGTADVDLVSETEVWVRGTLPTHAARLTLAHGRIVLHGTSPSLPFDVQFGGKSVKITPPPSGTVGVERVNRRASGDAKASTAVLRVFAAEGPVRVETEGHDTTLDGSGAVTVEADGAFSGEDAKAAPAWVTETRPLPFDEARGEQFLKYLPVDRPLVTSLVEASEDEQKEVCRLAISGLSAVGDIGYVVPLLNRRGDPGAAVRRKAAAHVLRAYLAQGPDNAKELRTQLQREMGNEVAAVTEKLLVGYTPKEAGEEATYAKLVQYLGTTDPAEVGVRELALENLTALTGRDDLDYNPDKPTEGRGLKAWRDLLHAKELRPATPGK